jgi:RNA polymerase sigma factor (TIGR02999 family)
MPKRAAAGSITDLLLEWRGGDPRALGELLERVYPELRRLAAGLVRREGASGRIEPMELVHEAYMRLVDQSRATLNDRRHFYAVASLLMRRVLVDRARAGRRKKRAGERVSLQECDAVQGGASVDLLALDEALDRLESEGHALERQVVEMRYFGGLTIDEVAEHVGVGTATVERAWSFAKAWLFRELTGVGAWSSGSAGPQAARTSKPRRGD